MSESLYNARTYANTHRQNVKPVDYSKKKNKRKAPSRMSLVKKRATKIALEAHSATNQSSNSDDDSVLVQSKTITNAVQCDSGPVNKSVDVLAGLAKTSSPSNTDQSTEYDFDDYENQPAQDISKSIASETQLNDMNSVGQPSPFNSNQLNKDNHDDRDDNDKGSLGTVSKFIESESNLYDYFTDDENEPETVQQNEATENVPQSSSTDVSKEELDRIQSILLADIEIEFGECESFPMPIESQMGIKNEPDDQYQSAKHALFGYLIHESKVR